MKYNLTDETYLPETIKNFPGAPNLSLWNMIATSLFYNLIPLIISVIVYFPIVYGIEKLVVPIKLRLILTAFVLTLTTPILYIVLNGYKHNNYYQSRAETIVWTLCFLFSITFYYLVNSKEDHFIINKI